MNMNCINLNEISDAKLIEKQTKVVSQIDYKLKNLFNARMVNMPETVRLDTDEQVSASINELLDIRKQCVELSTFGQINSDILDTYKIDYKAD
ncbi:hypothetical protein [Clostridium sp. FP1]|uniref:hypothetical protein n=1 Tax=Clostridium sp. FP1 TaxID=2724076 RepID=UPI0013E90681|nr:hypothetical protein [Clostridium sp. FP1]MBZ9635596.1 hypothetical protein [Clostridium sp. FP1]